MRLSVFSIFLVFSGLGCSNGGGNDSGGPAAAPAPSGGIVDDSGVSTCTSSQGCLSDGGADTSLPDASIPETLLPDASSPDGSPPDASSPDGTPPDASSPGAASPDACGGCPNGTTCGDTAGGVPACLSSTGIPRFSNVFVIMMENTALASVTEASNAPFIQSLIADWASGSNYHGVTHPSLGNYLELTSGLDTSVVKCDCEPVGGSCNALNCNSLLHSCGCPQSVMHLGDQLEAAGLTWMDYGEEMDGPCDTAKHGDYVPRHVPFLYYDNVQNDAARCAAHVVPYAGFAPDLVSGPASYSLIAPNLVHDMHKPVAGSGETNLANGNAWLSDNVPPILDSAAFTGGGLVVVVWDEDDSTLVDHDQPIGLIVMSPYAHHGGYVATAHADHNALLATIEDGLGLERLGAATSVEPLSDFFAP